MTKKYAIENEHGQWWTGECWGVKEKRKVYAKMELQEWIKAHDYDYDEVAIRIRGNCLVNTYYDYNG